MAKAFYSRAPRIFNPHATEPFKVSRSKIDLFIQCPRCFYMEARLGVKRPDTYPLTLNIAVDHLLKKEFDIHRNGKTPHPMLAAYGIKAIPFDHPKINEWRENFTGVQFVHKPTNLLVFGAVDDVWINNNEELHVVDYKATAKKDAPTLEGELGAQYQRQMEVYQWLLRSNDFDVSNIGYFVYVNGKKDAEAFDGKLEFRVHVIPCEGMTGWIEPTLEKIKACLVNEKAPAADPECDYCKYRLDAGMKLQKNRNGEAAV